MIVVPFFFLAQLCFHARDSRHARGSRGGELAVEVRKCHRRARALAVPPELDDADAATAARYEGAARLFPSHVRTVVAAAEPFEVEVTVLSATPPGGPSSVVPADHQ
jgi:hypothetical protein